MVKVKRPSAIDFWQQPAYYKGPAEPEEPTPVPAAPPPRQPIGVDNEDQDEENADGERFTRNKGLNPTCVTPLVATLSKYIYRDLHVAGPDLNSIDVVQKRKLVRTKEYISFMERLIELVHAPALTSRDFSYDERHKLTRRSRKTYNTHYSAATINGLLYNVNDIVFITAGRDGKHPTLKKIPTTAIGASPPAFAGDLFWFGRILSITRETHTAHVQWLEHGEKTILAELAHPQELYTTNNCQDVPLGMFIARCQYRKVAPGDRPGTRIGDVFMHNEFFYSMSYNIEHAVFRDIPEAEEDPSKFAKRVGSCGLCKLRQEAEDQNSEEIAIERDEDGEITAVVRSGTFYHYREIVFVRSSGGPCLIGRIESFSEETIGCTLTIQVFERVEDVVRGSELEAGIYEDRHLFLTDRMLEVSAEELLGKAFILHERNAFRFGPLRNWLMASHNHFYITKGSPSLERACQGDWTPLTPRDFKRCYDCIETEKDKTYRLMHWRFQNETVPMRIFDPFAGCGAFALGVCSAGNMKFTHAIEISPSAAETIRKNSPGTIVYCQCSNKMLEYAVSRENDLDMTLEDLSDELENVPNPPRREDIDCIVSGFPCQPHSTLNKFQRADDLLNELFLNTISWVDHLRPKYCIFENVEGFVYHRIGATQKDQHTVHGGIEQGGIKFIIRALTAMGYQVRFGLLQAAHYGTPQTRRRFFLWGARTGLPLPNFPERTHDFEKTEVMQIRFTKSNDIIAPISTKSGIAPLPYGTVAGAISDLKRWDWKNPHKVYKKSTADEEECERRRDIIQVRSYHGDEFCGLGGAEYEHTPRSAFQARSRLQPAEELQHVTPCLKDEIIESVINIPLEVGANYKSLQNKPGLWAWQIYNPSSANARHGHKSSLYARLEANKYFNTTVTNVGPTAKQSKVLNPWCKRIVTVRELARSQGFPDSFKFETLDDNVRTMHKMIGNAVPWPLGEALGRELEKAWYKETYSEKDEEDEEAI